MHDRLKAVAFDLDAASLGSLREALPESEIEVVNGATSASLSHHWNPGAADLLVVQAGRQVAETLGLCRFLVFSGAFSTDFREERADNLEQRSCQQHQALGAAAPLLVLVPSGQDHLVRTVLDAGAHSCLMLPIYAKDVSSMLVHALAGNQPGRHTLNLEGAQCEDRWRDDGGQG
jgi:hypothetical protein